MFARTLKGLLEGSGVLTSRVIRTPKQGYDHSYTRLVTLL